MPTLERAAAAAAAAAWTTVALWVSPLALAAGLVLGLFWAEGRMFVSLLNPFAAAAPLPRTVRMAACFQYSGGRPVLSFVVPLSSLLASTPPVSLLPCSPEPDQTVRELKSKGAGLLGRRKRELPAPKPIRIDNRHFPTRPPEDHSGLADVVTSFPASPSPPIAPDQTVTMSAMMVTLHA